MNVSKCYNPPNRKLIYIDLLDVIHDHSMKSNLTMINKESDVFGLLFLGGGATISRTSFLKKMVSGKNIPLEVYNFLIVEVIYQTVGKIWNLHMS